MGAGVGKGKVGAIWEEENRLDSGWGENSRVRREGGKKWVGRFRVDRRWGEEERDERGGMY